MRTQILAAALLLACACTTGAQSAADGPVLRAYGVEPTADFRLYNPAGSVRLVGWDRDSVVIRGRVANPPDFFFGASRRGGKGGIDFPKAGDSAKVSSLVVYFPRRGTMEVRTITADITSNDVGGVFYTVSGTIHVSGAASRVEAESMSGNIDLDVVTPWARAKTGEGHLLVRGSPQDVDASTVGGVLDVASTAILRGRFTSVTGDIRYAAEPAAGSLFEFSDHSGTVDFLLPRSVSGRFELSSVTGDIENGFSQVRPAAAGPHNMRLSLGRGDSQITVRTFKGTIRLRQR